LLHAVIKILPLTRYRFYHSPVSDTYTSVIKAAVPRGRADGHWRLEPFSSHPRVFTTT